MPPRSIVRDPARDRRWHIEGTGIAVIDLQQDYQRGGEPALAAYREMGLTDEEIEAALAFRFPSVGARHITATIIGLTVRCECGIERQTAIAPPDYETNACPCGRVWQVDVSLVPRVRPDTEPTAVEEWTP